MIQLCLCITKAAIDDTYASEHGCVPSKRYLQKQTRARFGPQAGVCWLFLHGLVNVVTTLTPLKAKSEYGCRTIPDVWLPDRQVYHSFTVWELCACVCEIHISLLSMHNTYMTTFLYNMKRSLTAAVKRGRHSPSLWCDPLSPTGWY